MGLNNFIALQTIPANTQPSAPQPIVDIWALIPPTGFEPGFTIICTGDFDGTIAIEGSLDGVGFNPIGKSLRARSLPILLAGDDNDDVVGGFTLARTPARV